MPFATGFGLGMLVAAQVGPVWLLCARSTLRWGPSVGMAIGAGAALVDLGYAALGILGVSRLLLVPWLQVGLGLAGAGVLLWMGGRTLWAAVRARAGAEADDEVASPRRALGTALAATASNPLTIASWASIFAATSMGARALTPEAAGLLLAGVGLGSLAWFTVLSLVVGGFRRRVGPRAVRTADALAGCGLLGFGGVLGWRALHAR